jgi:hypothetical protein
MKTAVERNEVIRTMEDEEDKNEERMHETEGLSGVTCYM